MKNEIFSTEEVNAGRQTNLDIAKMVLIFCLAYVHCIIQCSSDEALASGVPYFWDTVLGGPLGAPMFMTAMGVGIVYTRYSTPRDYILRGIKIVGLGYLLNVARYLIPYLIGYALSGDAEYYISDLVYYVFENDILQFAGLSLILIGFLKWCNLGRWTIWFIGLFLCIAGQFFNNIDLGNQVINLIFCHLIGIQDTEGLIVPGFPLFNWFIVLASGYLFGTYLKHVENKQKFYLMVSPVCLVITLIYFYIGIQGRIGMFGDGQYCYQYITIPDVFIGSIAAFGVLGIYEALAGILPKKAKDTVTWISKSVNSYYCIHWVVLIFITDVVIRLWLGTNQLYWSYVMLVATIVMIISLCITKLWEDYIKPSWRKTANEKA